METGSNVIVNETHSVGKGITFVWKIKNFSTCTLPFERQICSDYFLFQNGKFNLNAYYAEIEGPINDYNFGKINDYNFAIAVKCWRPPSETLVCAFTCEKKIKEIYNPMCLQINTDGRSSDSVHLFLKSELQTDRSSYLRDDCLTIICEMKTVRIRQDLNTREICYDYRRLSSDLMELLSSGAQSDVNLVVDGKCLPAHSLILRARSPVFAEMLQDGKELHTREINISDSSETAIRYLLQYLYSGELGELGDESGKTVMQLYTAAEKYKVNELRQMCSKVAASNISEHNAENYIKWSSESCKQQIVDLVILYFAKNKHTIGGVEWQKLLTIVPNLAGKVLDKVIQEPQELWRN